MNVKVFAMSLAAAALVSGEAAANGERIYYRGSEGAIAPVVAAPVVAGPAVAPPLQYQGPPAVAPVAAVPAATPGCVNCTPGSAQARNYGAGTPNAIVTFLHPYTNKAISIPMTLPVGKPTIITRSDRIIYDYSKCLCFGRYIVVRFFPDGTVMTEYN
jgi:hypothetical protein